MDQSRQEYAMDLMRRGHPRPSAARAAGCPIESLPTSRWRESPVTWLPVRFEPVAYITPGRSTAERVAESLGLTFAGLSGRRQSRAFAIARQAAMAAVRVEHPNLSLPQIGRMFNRDHTTVLHGIRQHNARMAWAEFLIWAGKPNEQPDLFARVA